MNLEPRPPVKATQSHVRLEGLRSRPLASYLSALGVFRLVAEQVDPDARGYWDNDCFVVVSTLDETGLIDFLAYDYQPSPIVAPWNGRAGFFAKDPQKRPFIEFEISEAPRFGLLRKTLESCWTSIQTLGLTDKPEAGVEKSNLLQICRNTFPERAVNWIDAVFVLTDDGPKAPPLLGSGGNDGSMGYTKYFADRLSSLFDISTGEPLPNTKFLAGAALFGTAADAAEKKGTMGQFDPGASGDDAWRFVLGLEGALFFASAAVRRVGATTHHIPAFPFATTKTTTGHGSAAATDADKTRGEMWMPLWQQPANLKELHAMMSEGRASLGKRPAKTGVDFARSLAAYGVDRGIDAFERYCFLARDGKNHYAVPAGRFNVTRQPQVDLLSAIDNWIERITSASRAAQAPSSVARAGRRLENAIFELTQRRSPLALQNVLVSLSACEYALGKSLDWTKEKGLRPLPTLDAQWGIEANDGSAEFGIAAAVASINAHLPNRSSSSSHSPVRENLEPVVVYRSGRAAWEQRSLNVVPRQHTGVNAMGWILSRRCLDLERYGGENPVVYRDHAEARHGHGATLEQVNAFVSGLVDDKRLWNLVRALSLVSPFAPQSIDEESHTLPSAAYGLIKVSLLGAPVGSGRVEVPLNRRMVELGRRGDSRCLELAIRRLNASLVPPAITALSMSPDHIRRATAAALIPLLSNDKHQLERIVLRTKQ